jgi:hypothetical protein
MTGHCGNCGALAELHVGDRWDGCTRCGVAAAFVADGAESAQFRHGRSVADKVSVVALLEALVAIQSSPLLAPCLRIQGEGGR